MPISFVQAKVNDVGNTSQTTAAVTLTNAVNAGDLFVLFFGCGGNGAVLLNSISDGHNSNYTLLARATDVTAGYTIWGYYCWNVAAATAGSLTITATFNGSNPFNFLIVSEYSGIQSSSDPLDVWSGFANGSSGTASQSATTTNASDLVTGLGFFDLGGEAQGSGYTFRGDATNVGGFLEDKTVSSSGSQTATATGTSGIWWIGLAAFKAAAAAASSFGGLDNPAPSRSRIAVPASFALLASTGTEVLARIVPPAPGSVGWLDQAPAHGPVQLVKRAPGSDVEVNARISTASLMTVIGNEANDARIPRLPPMRPEIPYVGTSIGWAPTSFLDWTQLPTRPPALRLLMVDSPAQATSAAATLASPGWMDPTIPMPFWRPKTPETPFVAPSIGWAPTSFVQWTELAPRGWQYHPTAETAFVEQSLTAASEHPYLQWSNDSPNPRWKGGPNDPVYVEQSLTAASIMPFVRWTDDSPIPRIPKLPAEVAYVEESLAAASLVPYLAWANDTTPLHWHPPASDNVAPFTTFTPPPTSFVPWDIPAIRPKVNGPTPTLDTPLPTLTLATLSHLSVWSNETRAAFTVPLRIPTDLALPATAPPSVGHTSYESYPSPVRPAIPTRPETPFVAPSIGWAPTSFVEWTQALPPRPAIAPTAAQTAYVGSLLGISLPSFVEWAPTLPQRSWLRPGGAHTAYVPSAFGAAFLQWSNDVTLTRAPGRAPETPFVGPAFTVSLSGFQEWANVPIRPRPARPVPETERPLPQLVLPTLGILSEWGNMAHGQPFVPVRIGPEVLPYTSALANFPVFVTLSFAAYTEVTVSIEVSAFAEVGSTEVVTAVIRRAGVYGGDPMDPTTGPFFTVTDPNGNPSSVNPTRTLQGVYTAPVLMTIPGKFKIVVSGFNGSFEFTETAYVRAFTP